MDNHSRRLSTKPVARLRWVAFNRYASPSTDGGLLGSRLLAAEYTGQPPGADRWRVTDAAAGGSISAHRPPERSGSTVAPPKPC